MERKYHNPNEYPYEKFIQTSIEKYFENMGYELKTDSFIDLIASNKSEVWIIEVKGITASVGTDFDTCMGQLAKRMISDEYKYGIAIPKHKKYYNQLNQLSKYYRGLTELHIFVIDIDSSIEIIYPNEDIEKVSFFDKECTLGR